MRRLFHIIILGFVVLLSGCSALKKSDLVGIYKDNNPLGSSSLVLNSDRTFSQVLLTKSGEKHISSGKWIFDNSEIRIDIDNALSNDFLNSSGQPQTERMGVSYSVEKSFQKVNHKLSSMLTEVSRSIELNSYAAPSLSTLCEF